jgi:hypothetical protein
MSEWQPIETAPIDTPVLVCWGRNSRVDIAEGNARGDWTDGEHWNHYAHGGLHSEPKPTYWMTLPSTEKL